MANIKLNVMCSGCNGTGIRSYNVSPGGALIEENPCSLCGGDGKAPGSYTLNDPWFDSVTEELDYIHKKVKKIWNKVKDDGDPEE